MYSVNVVPSFSPTRWKCYKSDFSPYNLLTLPWPIWMLPHKLVECFSPVASSPPLNSDASLMGLLFLCTSPPAFPHTFWKWWLCLWAPLHCSGWLSLSPFSQPPGFGWLSLQLRGNHDRDLIDRSPHFVAGYLGILICHVSHSLFW